jgi:outer membrane protein OmpA-like peptidoglycan-associated protein
MARARQLYNKARSFPVHLSKEIVSMAREATQTAEDGRAIAARRAAAEAAAENQVAAPREKATGQAQVQEHQPEPHDRVTPPPSRTAPSGRPQEQSRARISPAAESAAAPQPPVTVDHIQFMRDDPGAVQNRKSVLAALPRYFEVLDSSRGVVITIPGDAVDSALARSYFAAVSEAVKPYRGLHLTVEAHDDRPDSMRETERDARLIRDRLVGAGVSPEIVLVQGYGNARPRASNTTAGGRAQNRRVEIIIAGDPIGSLATWDRSYTLRPR